MATASRHALRVSDLCCHRPDDPRQEHKAKCCPVQEEAPAPSETWQAPQEAQGCQEEGASVPGPRGPALCTQRWGSDVGRQSLGPASCPTGATQQAGANPGAGPALALRKSTTHARTLTPCTCTRRREKPVLSRRPGSDAKFPGPPAALTRGPAVQDTRAGEEGKAGRALCAPSHTQGGNQCCASGF